MFNNAYTNLWPYRSSWYGFADAADRASWCMDNISAMDDQWRLGERDKIYQFLFVRREDFVLFCLTWE